jgi:hypothetical protein
MRPASGCHDPGVPCMLRRSPHRTALSTALLVVAAGLATVASSAPASAVDSPTGLAAGDSRIPVLSWGRVQGASQYDVQVSRTADFATTLATSSTVNDRYVPTVEMPVGEVWWRVRAKQGSTTGEWTTSSFERDLRAAPVPVQPLPGTTFAPPRTPRFSWNPVAGATSYTVQTGPDPAFTDPTLVATNTQRSTAAYLTSYPSAGTYHWRVRAEMSSGHVSAWSTPVEYRIEGLEDAVRTSPEDVFDKDDPRDVFVTDLVLDWEPRIGAATYQLRIGTDRNFLSTVHAASNITSTRYSPPTSLPNDDYFWQVRPVSASGTAAPWPDTPWRVTRAWPDQPVPVHPVGATPTGVPFFYEWEPIERASRYVVELFDENGLSRCESSPTVHTTLAGACVPPSAGTWTWRVYALDEPSTSATVRHQAFARTFTWAPPTPTTASAPLSWATGLTVATSGVAAYGLDGVTQDVCTDVVPGQCDDLRQTPLLTWDAVPGATTYKVVISNDAEGTNPHSTHTVTQPMWTPTTSFADSQAGSAYYWKVLACLGNECWGPMAFSHAFAKESFAPRPISPIADAEVADDVTLRWEPLLTTLRSPEALASSDLRSPATTDARQYVVQTSVSESFASVLDSRTVDQTSYTAFTTTYPEGPVWWRVAALDGSSRPTVWSAPQRFVKRSPRPTLLTPADGAPIGQDQTLTWDSVAFAKTYDVEVYAGATRVANASTVHTSWSPSDPFTVAAVEYTWRVRRIDAAGRAGEWTDLRSFRAEGFPPSLTAPGDGAVVAPSGALFSWQPDARATSYRFERRRPGSTTDIAETVSTRATSWAPTAALPAGTAQWRVTALDATGKALGSSPWRDVVVVDPPAEVTPVTIVGSGRVGTDLRVSAPTFSPPVESTTYQWYRGASAVGGATGDTYVVTSADLGKVVTVRATGTLTGYKPATSTSNAITGITGDAPVVTAPPVITGTAVFGETLAVTPGTWSDAPALRYQWYRDGFAISGADDPTYKVLAADVGKAVHVVETAALPGRTPASASSEVVQPEPGAAATVTTAPVVTGTPVEGQTLRVSAGSWTGSPSVSRQWFRDGVAVPGATGTSLRLTATDVGLVVHVVETARVAGRHDGTVSTEPVTVRAMPVPANLTAPRITGRSVPGQTLTAGPGAWDGSPSFTYQWFRDGVALGQPSSRATYTVAAADAARRLHVQVVASARDHRPATAVSAPVTVAKAPSTTTVRPSATRTPARKRVALAIAVSTPGITGPGGTVTVYDSTRRLATLRLPTNGALTYRLPKLTVGRHRVKVVYSGGAQAAGSAAATTLTVTKK